MAVPPILNFIVNGLVFAEGKEKLMMALLQPSIAPWVRPAIE